VAAVALIVVAIVCVVKRRNNDVHYDGGSLAEYPSLVRYDRPASAVELKSAPAALPEV
jgi:hypothetical protein